MRLAVSFIIYRGLKNACVYRADVLWGNLKNKKQKNFTPPPSLCPAPSLRA